MSWYGSNLGIYYKWALGENGWNTHMDDNLLKLDTLVHLSVISKDTATQPGSPQIGDVYILPDTVGGNDWVGNEGKIGVYTQDPSSRWVFYSPTTGMFAYIKDLDKFYYYKNSGGDDWVEYASGSGSGGTFYVDYFDGIHNTNSYTLTHTPNGGTVYNISVNINGVELQPSVDFIYISGDNRIVINGQALESGDRIIVKYTY